MRSFLTLLAVTLAAILPAHGVAQPVGDALIEIPFAPPTDAPLRYEVITEKESDGRRSRVTVLQELVYRSWKGAYRLTITTLSLSDGNVTFEPGTTETGMLDPVLHALMFAPVTLELDPNGTPIRIADWAAEREKLAKTPALIAAVRPSDDRAQDLEIATRAIAPFLQASAEEAVDLLVKYWPSVLGWGGTALSEGESTEYAGSVQSPLVPVMLPQQGTMTLMRNEGGRYVLSLRETTDSSAAQAVVLGYLETLGEPGDPKHDAMLARLRDELAGMTNTNTLEASFAPQTGLVESAVIERRIELAKGSGFERGAIRQLD